MRGVWLRGERILWGLRFFGRVVCFLRRGWRGILYLLIMEMTNYTTFAAIRVMLTLKFDCSRKVRLIKLINKVLRFLKV